MSIELSPALERLAREQAARLGLEPEAYVSDILHRALLAGGNGKPAKRSKKERLEAAMRIREDRKGRTLGDGVTIRDLINEGRKY